MSDHESVNTIAVGDDARTTAVFERAEASTSIVFICAHGAGGHMGDASVLAVTAAIRARGIDTVRFNFLYKEQRQRRPDPMPRLMACYRAVVAHVRDAARPRVLILGGRSMGGRVASMLVADGLACDGLLLLAYPLHPPGRPGQLRVDHLSRIDTPVLCVNGTRDPFCTPALMERTLAGLGANWRMHWLEGADHSFHVLKRSGRTNDEVTDDVAREIGEWTRALGS